jgi:hypothetical protein
MAFLPRLASVTQPPVDLSPERARLAEAISAFRIASAEMAGVDKAIASARSTQYQQQHVVDEAEAAIEIAKSAAAIYLAAVAMGNAGPAPKSIRQARAGLIDEQEALESSKQAVAALESRRSAGFATDTRDQAACAVMAAGPEVAAVIADVERLQGELYARGASLRFLTQNRILQVGQYGRSDWHGATRVDNAMARLHSPSDTWAALQDNSDAARFQSWRDALLLDATATLSPA